MDQNIRGYYDRKNCCKHGTHLLVIQYKGRENGEGSEKTNVILASFNFIREHEYLISYPSIT